MWIAEQHKFIGFQLERKSFIIHLLTFFNKELL